MFSIKCITMCKKTLLRTVKSYSSKKIPIIACKRNELNFYGETYKTLEEIPLASKGWDHNKSKGDYFVVRRFKKIDSKTNTTALDFHNIGLENKVVNAVVNQNISIPTDIQVKSAPVLLSGKNALITAETGCGKTLAYLLPLLQNIMKEKQQEEQKRPFNSPLAIILTPSRVLASQIYDVAHKLSKSLDVKVKHLIGGHTKTKLIHPVFQDVDLLVATPGAMSKLITTAIYKTMSCNHIVLDEADSLLDDSFEDKISYIIRKIKQGYFADPSRNPEISSIGPQLILVSATMPRDISNLLSPVVNPETIHKIISEEIHMPLPNIPQRFIRIGGTQKSVELLKLVRDDVHKKRPVIIFSNKTATSDWISLFLNENGIKCVRLNGIMGVQHKKGIYESFISGDVDVLSSTDIVSRGLDTIRAKHIINFDFPIYTSDYIHRCGRTGRIGSGDDCCVTNFVSTFQEINVVRKIELSIRNMANLPNVNANIKRVITERMSRLIEKAENQIFSAKA